MKHSFILFTLLIILSNSNLMAQSHTKICENTTMFPQAKENYKQLCLNVSPKKNETNYKIEIFIGKNQLVDCNHHFLIGDIQKEILKGWGYEYYTVESQGETASTMMACPDNNKTIKFVHLPSLLLNYNSQLPIIVYIPNDFKIHYKIWKRNKKTHYIK